MVLTGAYLPTYLPTYACTLPRLRVHHEGDSRVLANRRSFSGPGVSSGPIAMGLLPIPRQQDEKKVVPPLLVVYCHSNGWLSGLYLLIPT